MIFENDKLTSIFSLECATNLTNEWIAEYARGMFILDTDQNRYEADDLQLIESQITKSSAKFKYKTNDIVIDVVFTCHEKTGVWSAKYSITNISKREVTVRRALARFSFTQGEYEVYSQRGRGLNENHGVWTKVDNGTLEMACYGGRTCMGSAPFAALKKDNAGVIFSVLPNGNFVIRMGNQIMPDGSFAMVCEMGLSDRSLNLKLALDETYNLPEIIISPLIDSEVEKSAYLIHKYALDNIMTDKKIPPVAYNTWFDKFGIITLDDMKKQLQAAKKIGCEVFIIDAGWFGSNELWYTEVGNWQEQTERSFCGKMKEFSDYVRSEGVGFGIWMEPERVFRNAPIIKQHPEWLHFSRNSGYTDNFYIDFTIPEAREYCYNEICRVFDTYDVVWSKFDSNSDFGYDDGGSEFSRFYDGWYDIMARLKKRFPNIFFESCAGGGMRHELKTLSYSNGHFLTDTVNPIDMIRISEGAAIRCPPGYTVKFVTIGNVEKMPLNAYETTNPGVHGRLIAPTDSTWFNATTCTVSFAMKVGMSGIPDISADISDLPDYAYDEFKKWIAYYKTRREFLANSVGHLLITQKSKYCREGWSAIQHQNFDTTESIIFAYRLDNTLPKRKLFPRNLKSDLNYTVKSIDRDISYTAFGRELMNNGIEFFVETINEAEIIEIVL